MAGGSTKQLEEVVAEALAETSSDRGVLARELLAGQRSAAAVGAALRSLRARGLARKADRSTPARWLPTYRLAYPYLSFEEAIRALASRTNRSWRVCVHTCEGRRFLTGRRARITATCDGVRVDPGRNASFALKRTELTMIPFDRPERRLAFVSEEVGVQISFAPDGGWPPGRWPPSRPAG